MEIFRVSECKETPLQLTVEKVNKSSIVNVQFVDAETNEVIGGGDYFVDGDGDGIFTHREVVEYVPEGYVLTEFGDFQGIRITITAQRSEKEKESVVKIQFVDAITNEVVAGGDYFVDKDRDGIFNHSEVEQWVPEEYRLVEFGDFQVSECKETPLQLTVEKVNKSSIVNVQFVDAETNEVIGGGDYFVDGDGDGIFTHREVVEYVPEGYVLTEVGDFQVSESPLQLSVVKKEKESVVKIQFVDSITNEVVAGGDYFVDKDRDGIFNHSEVEQWVPEEYRLVEFGDFQVSECKETPLQLTVEKVNKSSIVKIQFVDAETNEVMGGGDYFVDGDGDGIFTHREVVEYVPEGYELAEFGDFQVAECKDTPLQLSVVKIKNDVKPDPENPDKPNPEKPDSEKPGNPDPEKPNNPDPEKPNKPDTQKPNKSNKNNTNADKKTPKTGDDLQAAGAFSVLGAGALAAIAALLKKRK